jgi:hypothetical protein
MKNKNRKMKNRPLDNPGAAAGNCRTRGGVVLLITLVLLVVLSTVGYSLASRVAQRRHRDSYLIDYQAARYNCDSAVKYALAVLQEIEPQLIERPNEPDFSDLFSLTEAEYEDFIEQWAFETALDTNQSVALTDANDILSQPNGPNIFGGNTNALNSPDSYVIRGPYGPPWPFVTKPAQFEIGSGKVIIQIEDENAKYPIAWALLQDEEINTEAQAALETFCEWMDFGYSETEALKDQLKQINEIKSFKLKFEPVKITERKTTTTKARRSRRTRRSRQTSQSRTTKKTIPATVHATDFARLFHSSLIDIEALARPVIEGPDRKESALKYMGMWASTKVNINTAPRHVLEAAFTFGGDADKIAAEIIRRRRIKPFKDIEELKKELFRYSDSIQKCEEYITTTSGFFTIKVTATSGKAKASAVIAITKDGKKVQKIAVISG